MTLQEYLKQLDNRIMLSLSLPQEVLVQSKLLSDSQESKRQARLFEERL